MQARARTSFAVVVAAVAATSGCQELVGIDPWNDGKGGASTASGVMASSGADMQSTTGAMTTSSADASSSSSGMPCNGCFGAGCTAGVCDPIETSLGAQILFANIAVLASDVVVATSAGPMASLEWTLASVDKYMSHSVVSIGETQNLTAMTVADPMTVYWASGNTLHARSYGAGGEDVVLSSPSGPVVNADALRLIDFGTTRPELCFTSGGADLLLGGIHCQLPFAMASTTHVASFVDGNGLTGDGSRAYGVQRAGGVDAGVVGADDLKNQAPPVATPTATALAYMDGRIYWMGATSAQIGWFTIANTQQSNTLATNVTFKKNKIIAHGQRLYFLTNSGIQRFDADLEHDTSFSIAASGPILDFAVDDTGVFWVTGGPNASVGLRGNPAP